jgi:hypothetical protein
MIGHNGEVQKSILEVQSIQEPNVGFVTSDGPNSTPKLLEALVALWMVNSLSKIRPISTIVPEE